MNLSVLLGKKVKDDDILSVLEDYQIEDVFYRFDRNHENTEDVYWAPARAAGFQRRFNQHQVLDTIFCYIIAHEGFAPISSSIVEVPIYRTFDEAEQACKIGGLRYPTSDAKKGPEFLKWWLRVESAESWAQYQFQNGSLFLVTLSLPKR